MAVVPVRAIKQGEPQASTSYGPPPPDVYTMMAAAQMHREGRLIDEAISKWLDSKNVEDRRGQRNSGFGVQFAEPYPDARNNNDPGDFTQTMNDKLERMEPKR